jgi:2-polyprenyl-6-hydroxyphenyl methylase/3-demethylubiquinone-9 3-methyltransferase
MDNISADYIYRSAEPSCSNRYLWPALKKIVRAEVPAGRRIFEVGCGNGTIAGKLSQQGFSVTGIDPSSSGIAEARAAFPGCTFEEGSAYDDLAARYGTFPLVISLEVVEHCFWPRKYAKTLYNLLQPGGVAVVSTPYHGYFKNLALALAGKFDEHWSPLWDGGHIKFWSPETLLKLLEDTGFSSVEMIRAGRIAPLAKSMIAIARK